MVLQGIDGPLIYRRFVKATKFLLHAAGSWIFEKPGYEIHRLAGYID